MKKTETKEVLESVFFEWSGDDGEQQKGVLRSGKRFKKDRIKKVLIKGGILNRKEKEKK